MRPTAPFKRLSRAASGPTSSLQGTVEKGAANFILPILRLVITPTSTKYTQRTLGYSLTLSNSNKGANFPVSFHHFHTSWRRRVENMEQGFPSSGFILGWYLFFCPGILSNESGRSFLKCYLDGLGWDYLFLSLCNVGANAYTPTNVSLCLLILGGMSIGISEDEAWIV